MRKIAASGAVALLALVASTTAQADVTVADGIWQARFAGSSPRQLSRSQSGVSQAFRTKAAVATRPAAPAAPSALLSAYESDLLARINGVRTARGLRPFRVSRGLTAAAAFHSSQMGLRGFFEHESANGAPFWKRIERFYPMLPGRSWSVGENLVWGSPDLSPRSALRQWLNSPPHRANLLSRGWREIGLGAVHFPAAPGEFRGGPVTIVTADFGTRA